MIELLRDGALATLVINRPDKANSLTGAMLVDLADAVETLNDDTGVNALVVTGRGKVFSAGADLDEAHAGLATNPVWERLSGAIAASPLLTIAALNGTAAGGALGMVLASDLRISVAKANIFYPVMKLGFLPQPSDPGRLADLVGPARAKLILMGGEKIGAPEALAMGLIDRIEEDPLQSASDIAADALAADRAHVAAIKSMLRN